MTQEPSAAVTTRRADPGSTLAVAAGTLLVLVAFTTPLTTLASTAAGLGTGPGAQAWVLSSMSLGAAAGLLSSGVIGDDYGRRRTFLAGTLLLAASSVLGAFAPTAPVLVVARVLQGLGGAAVLACSLGLIGHAFPTGPTRARATGVWGAALGAGVAVGPILAAGLDSLGGWRLPYAATALAAAALAVAGRALLSESRAPWPRLVDVAGTLLIGLGLAAFMAGLVEGRAGWDRLPVIVLLALGLALVGGFVAVESRIADPMLDLALLRRPDFVGATVALDPYSSIARLLPGLLVAGAANGVLNADLGRQAVASVPAYRAATGSGANNTARYVGSAIGITVVAVIVNRAGAPGAVGVVSGWNIAALITAGFSLLGALAVLLAREELHAVE